MQILNDINCNLFVAETIERIYNFRLNSVILTGRRIIFAQTVKQEGRNKEQLVSYRSWNILYRDILLVSFIFFDQLL